MPAKGARSALFFALVLRDARLHQLFNKSGRKRFVHREVDGPFGGVEALEFVLERLDHGRCGEQTAMVRKRGEPHQRSFVLERRHPVADGLGSLRWHSGPNRRANLLQSAAGRFRDGCQVLVRVLGSEVAFGARTVTTGIRFFHTGHSPRTPRAPMVPRAFTLSLRLRLITSCGTGYAVSIPAQ